MLSCFIHVQLFATTWPIARQAPLSWDFPSKTLEEGVHALLQGILLPMDWNQVSCVTCFVGRFLTVEPSGETTSCKCLITLTDGNIMYHCFFLLTGQEVNRIRHGTRDYFQIGKGLRQGCILSPCLFNLCAEYMQNARLDESQAGIKRFPGEISTASDMQMIPPLWPKAKRN